MNECFFDSIFYYFPTLKEREKKMQVNFEVDE